MDSERKCFRLVGGVLVERTVQEVLPAVEQHKAGVRCRAASGARPRALADRLAQIKQLIDTLSSQLKKKEEELNKLQVRASRPRGLPAAASSHHACRRPAEQAHDQARAVR